MFSTQDARPAEFVGERIVCPLCSQAVDAIRLTDMKSTQTPAGALAMWVDLYHDGAVHYFRFVATIHADGKFTTSTTPA